MSGYPTARAIAKPAGRDRIIIGGRDVTRFRDYRTPTPRYTLTEPYAYGATSIQFPQIHATLEYGNPDVTDLGWVKKGARVAIQRVDEDDNVTTDYVGVVIAIGIFGRVLNLDIGGIVSGRANLIDRQPPKRRRERDIGRWTQLACQEINVPVTPALGPVTGVEIPDAGGMTLLSWLDQNSAQTTLSGVQWALMPKVWGKNPWEFRAKNYTTKHLTLFTDDARVVVQLTDDASEQPNTWFASGVTPDGERWDGAKYPGYFEDEDPPDYPFADNRNFGIGTTDAETDNGDGVEVLKDKLVSMGYLPTGFGYQGIYDLNIYNAVAALKDDAGLSDNGTMTPAAWSALYDLDVTGYSGAGAEIYPFRQATAVRKWNYTPNGNLISRNDDYDPSVLRVDRTIDFGVMEPSEARKQIQGQAARVAAKNLTGTIRLNGIGAFRGEVAADDALTADDVMSYRDIRPGMNAWLPLVAGGTLVHISGVDVDDSGATLTVDTQARNMMEVAQIIARRRESRRDLRREWMVSNMGARPSGNMVSRDRQFGRRPTKIALRGDHWNTFPVVVGQSGTVSKTRIKLVSPATEFVVGIFSKKVTPKQLWRQLGNPFPVIGNPAPITDDSMSVWELDENSDWLDSKILLYAAGDETQPCGYGKHRKFNQQGDPTGATLTGLHIDDASWPYLCESGEDPVIWVAIYPLADCTLRPGRLLWALEDDVT